MKTISNQKVAAWSAKKHSDGYQKYKGVTLDKGMQRKKRFKARIVVEYKTINLGMFYNAIQAAEAYDIAAKKYFGFFANLNFKD